MESCFLPLQELKQKQMENQKVVVNIFGLQVMCTMTKSREGYTFKTPSGCGGRHYASFCNQLDKAFDEQHPELAQEINKRIRGEWPECRIEQHNLSQLALLKI